MKKLSELFDTDNDMQIFSIHSDSRYVRPNSVFFCVEGLSVDGHRYVDDAIFQGAKCIVHSKDLPDYQDNIVYIKVHDTLDELNRVSNIFYENPSKKLKVIGVTGTSGKTVIASMIKSAMDHYSPTGYIGTISVEYCGVKEQCPYTTPETIYLQDKLTDMVNHHVKVVAMEASSHGLALRRVDAINFSIAIMSNIGKEHLDFHGTVEQYVLSKRKLFEKIPNYGTAILNKDDLNYQTILEACNCKTISYGINSDAEIMAKNIELFLDHTTLQLYFRSNYHKVTIPVIAMFNVYNILALVGAFIALGLDDKMIVKELENLSPVEGRMEVLKTNRDFTIIVDYCQHTANYENIFKFVKETKKSAGKIIAVLGAPSKRDLKRRKNVGRLANQYCDHVIITELDRRGEDVESIASEIGSEIKDINYVVIESRVVAVEQAIQMANKDDVILLLGKGNETFISMPVGQTPYPGDKNVALEIIDNIFGDNEDEIQ